MPGPVLICAATSRELDAARRLESENRILYVTGAGIPLTLARLAPLIAERRPSRILNIGIAGAYPGSGLDVGDLVAGESEVFGDLGMELPGPEGFQPLREAPWADEIYKRPMPLDAEPFAMVAFGAATSGAASSGVAPSGAATSGAASSRTLSIKTGKGCTVNACTGTRATGERRRRLFGADFESMEGAAVALAGTLAGIPVAEIRAISNPASDRDMRPENVDLALRNLRACLDALGKDYP